MTALTIFILCIIGSTIALIGFVLILACVNSAQLPSIDMTGDAIYPDNRDHRNPVP